MANGALLCPMNHHYHLYYFWRKHNHDHRLYRPRVTLFLLTYSSNGYVVICMTRPCRGKFLYVLLFLSGLPKTALPTIPFIYFQCSFATNYKLILIFHGRFCVLVNHSSKLSSHFQGLEVSHLMGHEKSAWRSSSWKLMKRLCTVYWYVLGKNIFHKVFK